MAYNGFGYIPNSQYYPQYNGYTNNYMQQPMQRPQMQSQDTPINEIKFVTADEAKAYIVMPNTNAMLIDRTNKIAYIKSADNLGQSRNVMYKFEEITGEQVSQLGSKPQEIDTSLFIKKEELDSFVKKADLGSFITKEDIATLNEKIDKLQKQIKINEILGENRDGK